MKNVGIMLAGIMGIIGGILMIVSANNTKSIINYFPCF